MNKPAGERLRGEEPASSLSPSPSSPLSLSSRSLFSLSMGSSMLGRGDGSWPSMFVCPACALRLTARLREGEATAVRCECMKEFVVKLPAAGESGGATKRRHRARAQRAWSDSSSSETES
eukprot:scaffold128539_cov31-Tisochrysis_lutea.AAC.7